MVRELVTKQRDASERQAMQWVIGGLLAAIIYAIDLAVPLGVAAGVLYSLVVLHSLWSLRRRDTYLAAVVATLLTVAGFLLSSPGGVPWMAMVNRGLGIVVIWITAALVLQRKKVEAALTEAQAERAGRESETRFRGLLESAPDAMVIVDGDGLINLVNAQTEALFGYDRDELLGKPVEILMPEATREQHVDSRADYFASPRVRSMGAGLELHGRRKNGSELPIEISLSPFETPDGVLVSAAVRDITDRKKAQEELRFAKHAAEQASTAKTRFLAAASHDLRQPLQAATMYLSVLSHQISDPRPDTLDKLRFSLEVLTDLINKLLDISRLDAGSIAAEKVSVSPLLILERLVEGLEPEAAAKGIELRVKGTDCRAHSDPQLLEQVLQNFLTNAVRYTERGGVLAACRRAGSHLRLQVWDTGVGIPDDQLEAVFDEFHQVGNRSRSRRQGLGLGLAIVKRLAALLDHPLRVRSRIGRGTVFELLVPTAHVERSDVAEDDHVQTSTPAALVVVIDDEPEVLDALCLSLEVAGHEVVATDTIDAALRRLVAIRQTPDLILSDYRLAGNETGFDAIRRIRAAVGSEIPGILLTGDSSPELTHSDLPVLHKPVMAEELDRIIRNVLVPD